MDTSKSFPLSKQDDWFPYHIEREMARNLFKFSYQFTKLRKTNKTKPKILMRIFKSLFYNAMRDLYHVPSMNKFAKYRLGL